VPVTIAERPFCGGISADVHLAIVCFSCLRASGQSFSNET
jgi:hypothetical protein